MMISENSSAVYGQKDFVFFTAFFFPFSLYTQIGRKRQISLSRRWVSSKCERERWQSINLLLIVIFMRRGLRFSFEFEFVFVFELRMRLGHTQLVLLPVVAAVVELLLLSFNGVQRWHNNILLCILLFAVFIFLFGNIKVCAHCLIKFDFVARFGVGARSSSTSHGWQTEQNDVAAAVARARGMASSCPNRTRDNAPSSTAQHAKCTERMWKKTWKVAQIATANKLKIQLSKGKDSDYFARNTKPQPAASLAMPK